MDKKKLIISVVMLLCFGAFGIAGWIITAENSITGQVVSMNGKDILVFTDDFEDFDELDTTESDQRSNKTVTLRNDNGDFDNMLVTIETNFVDNASDSCEITPGECEVTFNLDGSLVEDGDLIALSSGQHQVEAVLECERLSCPQTPSATIRFSE